MRCRFGSRLRLRGGHNLCTGFMSTVAYPYLMCITRNQPKMRKTRYLDHIDLRVTDLKRAHKFYSKLLPALGFIRDRSSGRWGIFYAAGGDKPEAFFGFTQDRRHQPNGTRIAFWAYTREEVDRLAGLIRKIG